MKDYRLEPPDPIEVPECPCCGSTEYSFIFKGDDGDGVIGCDDCISEISAETWWEELAEKKYWEKLYDR